MVDADGRRGLRQLRSVLTRAETLPDVPVETMAAASRGTGRWDLVFPVAGPTGSIRRVTFDNGRTRRGAYAVDGGCHHLALAENSDSIVELFCQNTANEVTYAQLVDPVPVLDAGVF